MRHFGKKVTYNGIKFDSQKECDFFKKYLENCKYRVEIHQRFQLLEKFPVCGYNMSGIAYTPDFVVYDQEGQMLHVYDVKTGLTSWLIDPAAKIRFKLFAWKHNLPVEVVVPRAHDFKMKMPGFTTNTMHDKHVHYDKHGKMKINKDNGQPIYDHYNVYKDINYDIHDLVGW